ncbi:hypothetical protein N802_00525 [Knoellia sinensis KCTC 19936]|uniref:Uncharacterized protein n=1 Tax=Knoellia sinensis KCTC 19936 TaxID=1385520 RepID=A0A0A0JG89_9MICO|nr:hypothetical protein [Knoellia sinensis]KGN34611.1 hypothetical protein N802_00525 [Knoellia sinensis KCTC 19936]
MASDPDGDVAGDRTVADAAASLYAVPLAEFVTSRKALAASAKSAGGAAAAKEILALRKPTVTAWAMNLTSRDDGGVVADLVGLGARMRAAQARLDASVLTSVRGERDAALTAYVERVAEVATTAGGALSASGRDEVRATAIAALADESAAEALASGQLTRALSYSGFGEVDLSGAVGVTSSGSIMSVLKGGKPEVEPEPQAGEDLDDDELTEEELKAAVVAARAVKAAARERRKAEAEVDEAEAQMAGAQADLEAAEDAARVARKAVIAAQKRLDAARAALQ